MRPARWKNAPLLLFLLVCVACGGDNPADGGDPPMDNEPPPDPKVEVTYLGNDGIMLAYEDQKVLIDATHANLDGWVKLSSAERNKLQNGTAPYDGIDLVLTTHNHTDHLSTTYLNAVLASNPDARAIAPPQARAGITSTRLEGINPAFGSSQTTTVNGITVEVLHLRHFNQFNFDFSTVQNYGYLVTLNNKRFLHLGDVDYSEANLQPFNLASKNIEAVFLPTFNTLISAANRDVISSKIDPDKVVALHFQTGQISSETARVEQLFSDPALFTQALQKEEF